MLSQATRRVIQRRLDDEVGRIEKSAPLRIALAYPSPYSVGMSSLGYQQIYRILQSLDGVCCERVFLPDLDQANPEPAVSYERLRPLGDFPVIALSVAYELELAGVISLLANSGIPTLGSERTERHPLVIAGGPLTFSNPLPLAPFVDAIVIGEAEGIMEHVVLAIQSCADKKALLDRLAEHPHIFVPSLHEELPPVGKCDDEVLPARSVIRTPHTELANMFLVEAERGCSRGCQYCVMRRSTNGGMRVVPPEVILGLVPEDAKKVGLVGAAVSDHPKIVEIVNALVDSGRGVGLSSLRPDRLKEPFVMALKRAGYRTLTTALDGISEAMRQMIERRGREEHFRAAAENARSVGMERLKLYLMLGLPGETDADIDEGVGFITELSQRVPIALGIAPFCAKRKTPLDAKPFAGIDVVSGRLERLRAGLRGKADVRATSAKWAWVEYVLAQGNQTEGLAVLEAVQGGGRFSDYKKAFEALGYSVKGEQAPRLSGNGYVPIAPHRKSSRKLPLHSST
ncbi:MAG TPA: radical SAM protein [Polyangiaceae bacterium]|jgi:radical SAM superfamily enzyme YgiQ (UPF0313 family)|nr:radical SAM protein [Polyangiaceae bacterium]